LDAAVPDLLFNEFRDELPNISEIAEKGVYGRLRSCDPPVTIPAWACMVTGATPGELGLYGFKGRRRGSYTEMVLPSSFSVKERKIWDHVGDVGGRACVVGVPPTYPPQPIKGWLISGMMTPSTKKNYTYPVSLRWEVERLVGEYVVDVPFRRSDANSVLREAYEMAEKRFKVVEHLLKSKPWDFFMFVEMGLDRVQHALWKYFDKEHHLYEPGNEHEDAIRNYYKFLDERIGRLLSLVEGDAAVLIVSDHGAKRMKGSFCVNQWLAEEGYLKLEEAPDRPVGLEEAKIDWSRTVAWAWGGPAVQLFINVKGRERSGAVDPSDYESVREQLARDLEKIGGPNGERWNTKVFRPEEVYPACRGSPPDLIAYLDDLHWRPAESLGHGSLYLSETDVGPDSAVHDYDGVFVLYDPEAGVRKEASLSIYDVAPLVLELMGLSTPSNAKKGLLEKLF